MRLNQIKKDGHYYVRTPNARLARVDKEDTWEVELPLQPGQLSPTIDKRPCLVVTCTVPGVEIEGFVTKKAAQRNQNILNGLRGGSEDDEYDHRVWQEVWCERRVGKLTHVPGGRALERSETEFEVQVYCAAVLDMQGRTLAGREPQVEAAAIRGSGIYGAEIDKVEYVAKAKIKGDAFTFKDEEAEPEAKEAKA